MKKYSIYSKDVVFAGSESHYAEFNAQTGHTVLYDKNRVIVAVVPPDCLVVAIPETTKNEQQDLESGE